MPTSSDWHPDLDYAVLSDVGMRRANNQDAATAILADSEERWRQAGHLFVVADGMGAHAAGELASRVAVEMIPHYYLRPAEHRSPESLREAIARANTEIHRRGQQNPEFHNMGTTASALALLPDGAVVAHVGDSRVYRLRRDRFEQLTFDHSLVWEMEASGQVKPNSELSGAIPKNVITRSLGPNAEVLVDLEGPLPVDAGDVFLLCSDGLTGQVDDEEIGTLIGCLPPTQAARVLVDLANLRGGPDNITVVIVKVGAGAQRAVAPAPVPEARGRWSGPLLATAVAGLVAAGLLLLAGTPGPAAIALLLALLAGAVAAFRWRYPEPTRPDRVGDRCAGAAPYRKYTCRAGEELVERLASTVQALREAAEEKQWTLDWTKIDDLQQQALAARDAHRFHDAVSRQSQAIIETMRQLREHNRRQASDSTVDY